jgi:hypothetical protein
MLRIPGKGRGNCRELMDGERWREREGESKKPVVGRELRVSPKI